MGCHVDRSKLLMFEYKIRTIRSDLLVGLNYWGVYYCRQILLSTRRRYYQLYSTAGKIYNAFYHRWYDVVLQPAISTNVYKMCTHVYTCVQMCTYVYKYVQMCTNMYKCVHMCTNVYKCVQICTNVYKYVQLCTHVYKCVQMCTNVYKCVQMCTNVYKCVQICTNVYKCVQMCTLTESGQMTCERTCN